MMDTRLLPLASAVWLAALVVPVLPPDWHPVLMLGTACPLVVALLLIGRAPRLSLLLFGVVVGCAVTTLHVRAVHSGPVGRLAAAGAIVTVDLGVRTDPDVRAGRGGRPYVMFDAELRAVQTPQSRHRVRTGVLVTASPAWQRVEPGARVRTLARLAATDRGDEQAAFVSARGPPRMLEPPGRLDRWVNHVRAALREAVRPLPEAERGLLPSLVVGDTTRLPVWVEDDLRDAGLSHLTAVSGANLTILLGFVLALTRAARVRAWGVPVIGLVVVAGFVLVCRPEPSVIRAAAMGIVGLAGLGTRHRRTGLPALAIAVTGLLLVDPWLGRSYGFTLSVLATAGILLFAPGWTTVLERRMPHWLAVAITVPLAAQLAVTPVLVMLDGEISVVAVVANLLTGPVVPLATVFGFAALSIAVVLPVLAQLMAWIAFPSVWWIVGVAGQASSLPGATVRWPAGIWSLAVLALGCVILAIAMVVVLRRPRLLIVIVLLLLVWLVRPGPFADTRWLTGWPPNSWALAACDVGQGDALVVNTGGGTGVLVDTGPEPDSVDGCLRSLGIQRLELVVLTHFHHDHVGGLSGALAARDVGQVWTRPVTGSEEIVAELAADGVVVRQPSAGYRVRVGTALLTVLGPDASWIPAASGTRTTEEGTAENDASIVLLVEIAGLRVLLTGDVEPAGQRRLLRWGDALDVDVLKVPHHGARYQDPTFLDRTSPRLGLISVGAENDYGHPAPATLAYFAARGIPVARTDRDGMVLITVIDGSVGLLRRAGGATGVPRSCRRDVGC